MGHETYSAGELLLADEPAGTMRLGSYTGFHALVPVMIGFSTPLILFLVATPSAASDVRFVAAAFLGLISVTTAALFLLSLLRPGITLEAHFDPKRRVARFVRAGLFAHTVYSVPFSRIRSVRVETEYDDDGYASLQPLIILEPRELIELPSSTTGADITTLRRMIGLD